MKNKQRGITLIALVITIIVLLILAGVTIATISGNNSAPQKATEAAQKDAIAGAKDEIAMETQEALLDYYNDKYVSQTSTSAAGKANVQDLVANAAERAVTNAKSRNKQLEGSSVNKSTYKITLKTKSFEEIGTIEENGGITWGDSNPGETPGGATTLSTADLIAKRGEEVTYSGKTGTESIVWRLFYTGDNEVYLITKDRLTLSGINTDNIYVGEGSTNEERNSSTNQKIRTALSSTYATTWNAKWLGKLSSTTQLTGKSFKATAYLCDPANWTIYVGTNAPQGTYAVGGPTKELLAAAWQQAGYEPNWDDDNDVYWDGYKYNRPSGLTNGAIANTILPYTTNGTDGLFNNGQGDYWLASPASNESDNLCGVSQSGGLGSGGAYGNEFTGRPIVVVPRQNIKVNATTGKLEVK